MITETLKKLRQQVRIVDKEIPIQYEEPILKALSYYPELRFTKIKFKPVQRSPVPYSTTPSFDSMLKPAPERTYYVRLLEHAKEPVRSALFKNLSLEAQTAVIAHELVHVCQYNNCTSSDLLKVLFLYSFSFFKKILERNADIGTINHGFGKELYDHTVFIRNIPGYIKKRPELDKYYLRPEEIIRFMR